MSMHARQFWQDEAGFILSAELVLIATICVIGLVAGLSCVRDAMVAELNDVGAAFRSVQQSYAYSGMHGCLTRCGTSSWVAGSAYLDGTDVAVQRHVEFGCFDGAVEQRVAPVVEPCVPAPQPAIEYEYAPPSLPVCPPPSFEPCESAPVPAPSFNAYSAPPAPCGCETQSVVESTVPCQLCNESVLLPRDGLSRERYFWQAPSSSGRVLLPTNLVW